jgi:lipopolysaccharide/colanic/teichoic acid biosynthesis glycosyltransferase
VTLHDPVLEAEPLAFVATSGVERPRVVVERLGWPITRLGAWGLTLLLFASIVTPALVDGDRTSRVPLLVLCAVLATAVTKSIFTRLARTRSGATFSGVVALTAAALAGAVTLAGAAELLNIGLAPIDTASTSLSIAGVLVLASVLRALEVRYELGLRRVYLVGSDNSERSLQRELARHPDVTLVGRATVSEGSCNTPDTDLRAAIIATRASVLVLDRSAMQIPALTERARSVDVPQLHVWDLISYYEHKLGKVPLAELTPEWFAFGAAARGGRRFKDGLRRAVDVGVAGALLVVVCIPLLAAGILIRLTSPGAALYRQRRVGRDGRPFTLLKLRTMTNSAGEEAVWAESHDKRVTPIGRQLRRFRLDELPQLWNVLRGDLALIGPRPEQVPIAGVLAHQLPHYEFRHSIRPGITGWAQVHLGYAGSVAGAAAKLQRDLYYVKRRSLRLDLLIVWLTLKLVLEGQE